MTPVAAAVAFDSRPALQISVCSDPLGTFAIAAEDAIEFTHGILGFPGCQRFALVRAGTDSLYWLQSLDYGALLFLLTDPFVHFPGYAVDITPIDHASLGIVDPADLAVLAIVTLPAPGSGAFLTANLQGPIAINLRARTGKQLVCANAEHGVRRELRLPAFAA